MRRDGPPVRPELYWQDLDLALLLRCLTQLDNQVVVDVGAERGSFTAGFLEGGATVVHAFEPYPPLAAALRQRFSGHANVHVHELALGARDEPATLHIPEDGSGRVHEYLCSLTTHTDTPDLRWRRSVTVHCRALGSLVEEGVLPAEVGVVKIDTEGHDLNVVRGLGRLRSSVIVVEYWEQVPAMASPRPYALEDMRATLTARRFSRVAFVKRRDEFQAILLDSLYCRPGDWGNLLFVHESVAPRVMPILAEAAAQVHAAFVDRALEYRNGVIAYRQAHEQRTEACARRSRFPTWRWGRRG